MCERACVCSVQFPTELDSHQRLQLFPFTLLFSPLSCVPELFPSRLWSARSKRDELQNNTPPVTRAIALLKMHLKTCSESRYWFVQLIFIYVTVFEFFSSIEWDKNMLKVDIFF